MTVPCVDGEGVCSSPVGRLLEEVACNFGLAASTSDVGSLPHPARGSFSDPVRAVDGDNVLSGDSVRDVHSPALGYRLPQSASDRERTSRASLGSLREDLGIVHHDLLGSASACEKVKVQLCLADQLPVPDLVAEQLTEAVSKAVGAPWSTPPSQDLPSSRELKSQTLEAMVALTGAENCVVDREAVYLFTDGPKKGGNAAWGLVCIGVRNHSLDFPTNFCGKVGDNRSLISIPVEHTP